MTDQDWHSLLRRQLRKYPGADTAVSDAFLTAVNRAYWDADHERSMLERSLDLMSHELLQRNTELSDLLAALPDLCVRLDGEGRVLSVHGQSGLHQAWPQPEPGSSFFADLAPEALPPMQAAFAAVISENRPQLLRLQLQAPAGLMTFELRLTRLFEQQCLIMIRNITEMAQWQEALEMQNRQLLTYHLISELLMTAETLTLAQQKIVRELAQMTGFHVVAIEHYDAEAQTMVFQACSDERVPEGFTVPLHQTLSGTVARSGEPLLEYAAQTHAEHSHPILQSLAVQTFVCVPLKWQEQVVGVLSLGSREMPAVSEALLKWLFGLANYLVIMLQRRQEQVELAVSKQQAEAANQAKNRFLATMSHELRTPLNAVLGFARLLQKRLRDELSQKYLPRIYGNAMHLLALINDVLDIARIESEAYQPNRETFSLPDLLQEVEEPLQEALAARRLRYVRELPEPLPLLHSDPAMLRQILGNLLHNAIKFTPEEGMVRLSIVLQDQAIAAIQIADTGIGIPQEIQQQIFEPFFQAESNYDRRYEGTGLGLAICRSLCEGLGYALRVHSQPGQGSCFELVMLPTDS